MDIVNVKRGNETEEHRLTKIRVSRALRAYGLDVFFECGLCDLIAFDAERGRTYVFEIERSTRNLVRNIRKGLQGGGHAVVIVCIAAPVMAQAKGMIERHLDPSERNQTVVTMVDDICSSLHSVFTAIALREKALAFRENPEIADAVIQKAQ